ncbi:MAG: DUF4440 domain-containing protein [Gammaproteobacteria bacterium]
MAIETLRTLEVALHRPEVRSDRGKLDGLLHPRFREFGRSGRIYAKAEILAEFSDHPQTYAVWSQDFQVEPLSKEYALLTYRSAHLNPEGKLERYTNRSSLWQLTEHGWQMLFHQGTPAETFSKNTI